VAQAGRQKEAAAGIHQAAAGERGLPPRGEDGASGTAGADPQAGSGNPVDLNGHQLEAAETANAYSFVDANILLTQIFRPCRDFSQRLYLLNLLLTIELCIYHDY
jgi:hypothetical protein